MAIHDYKCDNEECDFIETYYTHLANGKPPEDLVCPKCKEGKLEQQFSGKVAFDIVGYCYENHYGKKNWKKHLSADDQAKVLQGKKNPY